MAIVFEFVDKAFDDVAFTIQRPVNPAWLFAPSVRGNHSQRTLTLNLFDQRRRIVTCIANDEISLPVFQPFGCLRDIMRLSRGQAKAQGIAQGISQDMQFGGEAAATAS